MQYVNSNCFKCDKIMNNMKIILAHKKMEKEQLFAELV